jgi:glycosyltransferase involved in cell wall biosynthesis
VRPAAPLFTATNSLSTIRTMEEKKPPATVAGASGVSVVVPTFNQVRYLPACLDSLWFQTCGDLEIVVVNDGSTDETAAALAAYLKALESDTASYASRYDSDTGALSRVIHDRYPKPGRRIKVVSHEKNLGLASALNSGFGAAAGEYCTYVPSDDWAYPDMIEELWRALLRDGADFAYGDMHIVNDEGRILRHFGLPDYSFARCFADWYLCGDAKLYRRALHDAFGYYDTALLAHDHELFLRFAMGGAAFTHVARPLLAKRDHSGHRAVDIHAPDTWSRLIEESKALALTARDHLARLGRRQPA